MERLNLKYLFLGSLALAVVSWRLDASLYRRTGGLLPETHAAPAQAELTAETPRPACYRNGFYWKFTPLADYSAAGLVFGVSHKLASRFDGIIAADVGLLWGENAAQELYRKVMLVVMMDHYNARWSEGTRFNLDEAANTHVVTCDEEAFKAVKAVRQGDQVRLKGWLVKGEASEDPKETDPRRIWNWQSSLTRKDKGEGACEVLYVRSPGDVQVLRKGARHWLFLKWLGLAGMALAAWLWHGRIKRAAAAALAG